MNNCGCEKGVREKAYKQAPHFVRPGSVEGFSLLSVIRQNSFAAILS